MPNYPGSGLAVILLLVASVGPKLLTQGRSVQIDSVRLNRDIAQRLAAAGFRTSVESVGPAPIVRARRGTCRLLVRNGDRARELGTVFELEAAHYGPVLIGYRGVWTSRPAPARAIVERFVQDGVGRVGVNIARPAVIAVARSGPCAGVASALSGISAYASSSPPGKSE